MPARGRHPHNRLKDLILRQLGPGRHADGAGLYFLKRPTYTCSWVQRLMFEGSRHDLGLGPYPLVSLAEARGVALENKRLARSGGNPMAEAVRRKLEAAREKGPTVREIYEIVTENRRSNWKRESTEARWRRSFEIYVFPSIGTKPVVDVTLGDLRRIVISHWGGRNSLGYYIRQNLEDLFDWVVGEQLRSDNPAVTLKRRLPNVRPARNRRPSLPYAQAPEALAHWEALPLNPAIKLVLPFIVLTAARLREATDATWGEIDPGARLWQVPKERMKGDRAHTVPLSDQALDIVERARALRRQSSLIFPLVGRDGLGGHPNPAISGQLKTGHFG